MGKQNQLHLSIRHQTLDSNVKPSDCKNQFQLEGGLTNELFPAHSMSCSKKRIFELSLNLPVQCSKIKKINTSPTFLNFLAVDTTS